MDRTWPPFQRSRQGVRAPVVFYQSLRRSRAQLKPGDFNWKEIFSRRFGGPQRRHLRRAIPGYRRGHYRGHAGCQGRGAVTSFDLNYRASLEYFGGHERAVAVAGPYRQACGCSRRATKKSPVRPGIPGPEVAAKSKLDPSAFIGMNWKNVYQKDRR